MKKLRLHAIIERSKVNGPGERLTIWTQGCAKACKGCFNPETWAFESGELWEPTSLAARVRELDPQGLTLTGGDPLEQPEALAEFLAALHEPDGSLLILPLGILCFTGYTVEEIEVLEGLYGEAARRCVDMIDVLIDGRFVEAQRVDHVLAGSSNQRFHWLCRENRGEARIPRQTILTDQEVELHAGAEIGVLEVTGFPNVDRRDLSRLGIRVL